MRKYAVLAAAAGMALAGVAKADFQVTTTPSNNGSITPTTSGWKINVAETPGSTGDLYKIFALNTGTGDQAGTANVLGITLNYHDTTGKGLLVRSLDNGDGTTSYNFDGTVVPTGTGSTRGTYVGAGAAAKWFTVEENGDTTTPGTGPGSGLPDPASFSNVHVVGLANFAAGGVPAGTAANGGLGAQIGQIVIHSGDQFSADGSIGAENGPQSNFTFTNVPEPASISLLGLGLGALVARRRRA